jgi:hypothetical protein
MIENDDGRSAFPLSSLKYSKQSKSVYKPRDEGAECFQWNCHETQESVADLACLFLAVQKLDLCFADWRFCFVCFDKPEKMHSA